MKYEYIQSHEASFFFLAMIGHSISGETIINIQHSPDVDSVPLNSYLRFTCNVTRPPATVDYFWEKTQDVTVPIYFNNNGDVIYQDSSPNIEVSEWNGRNVTQVLLEINPIRNIDAGVYTCGYISSVNKKIKGSKSTPLVSVAQVKHANVSLNAITDEMDGVFHFTGPGEVLCRATLQGTGQRVKVEIGSRDITYAFSLQTAPMEWRGTTDGFKSQVQEIQLQKRDFFPPRNDTLVCTVYGGRYGEVIASKALNVTGDPEYTVPVSLKCFDIYEYGTLGDTECTVFDVDIGDVVEFHWRVEYTPGRFITFILRPPLRDRLASHSFVAYRPIYGASHSDSKWRYLLVADGALPKFGTRRPTVEARVFTTNAGNASFILGRQVRAGYVSGGGNLVTSLSIQSLVALLWAL